MITVKELQEALSTMPPEAKIELLINQYNKTYPFYIALKKDSWDHIAINPFPTDNTIVRLFGALPDTNKTYFVISERTKK